MLHTNTMRTAIFSFLVAALSVQQAVSIPFDKRDASKHGMYIDIMMCLPKRRVYGNVYFILLDTEILQFALTLEHVEVAFYTLALQQLFNQLDFIEAGYTPLVFRRFLEIGQHEQTHAALLTAALGDQAPLACNYSLCVFFFLE